MDVYLSLDCRDLPLRSRFSNQLLALAVDERVTDKSGDLRLGPKRQGDGRVPLATGPPR